MTASENLLAAALFEIAYLSARYRSRARQAAPVRVTIVAMTVERRAMASEASGIEA
jgi:hypothetical protein